MEQIKLFIEKIESDKALQEKINELMERKAGNPELVALANESGYEFTLEDFEQYIEDLSEERGLDNDPLAQVAGGGIGLKQSVEAVQ